MTNTALVVTNGHGEVAIAARIARELPSALACDHLALVGDFPHQSAMRDVGPRRAMPSGGLIAMGNVRNILQDVRAGLPAHTLAQLRFLHGVAQTYCAAIAVGDVYALLMALGARARATIFVGTAKSVYVARYGALEQLVLRKAQAVYVRDEATALDLRERGIDARSANVIVDLYAGPASETVDVPFDPCLALFPGSRQAAYGDAIVLCAVVRDLAGRHERLGALLSVAPGLDPDSMANGLAAAGWDVRRSGARDAPFALYENEREIVRAWRGSPGAMLRACALVLGQAGTANEAAAAAGIPVVALEPSGRRAWYRNRQIALLGEALLVLGPNDPDPAQCVDRVLGDESLRARMSQAGRSRMGPPGAAKTIAREVARWCG